MHNLLVYAVSNLYLTKIVKVIKWLFYNNACYLKFKIRSFKKLVYFSKTFHPNLVGINRPNKLRGSDCVYIGNERAAEWLRKRPIEKRKENKNASDWSRKATKQKRKNKSVSE